MNGLTSKQVTIKLFYNLSDRTFYIQLGDVLIRAKDTLITAIQEKEGLQIRHAKDMKDM